MTRVAYYCTAIEWGGSEESYDLFGRPFRLRSGWHAGPIDAIVAASREELQLDQSDTGGVTTITLRRRGVEMPILRMVARTEDVYDLKLIGELR